MTYLTESNTEKSAGWLHRIAGAALVVCAPVVASYFYLNQASAGHIGEFIGYYSLYCSVGALLLQMIPAVKQKIGFMLMFGVLFVGAAGYEISGKGSVFRDTISKTQTSSFLDEFQRIMVAVRMGQPIIDKEVNGLPKPYQDFLYMFRDTAKSNTEAFARYQKATESEEISNILSPRYLSEITGVSNELNLVIAEQNYARAAYDAYFIGFPQNVMMLDIDQAFKDNFMKGWNNTQLTANDLWIRFFDNQSAVLNTMKEVQQLCAASETRYDLTAGQIVFFEQANLDRYNALMGEMYELTVEESKVLQEMAAQNRNAAKQFTEKREKLDL